MDRKLKHLEFIQGVINRLSTNSFLLKGWSVVLVSGLIALGAHNSNGSFVMIAYIPAFVFWGLDGYFVRQERLFRRLYGRVRNTDADDIDFDMDTSDNLVDLSKWDEFKNDLIVWVDATISKTLIPFHGSLIVAIVVVMFVQS